MYWGPSLLSCLIGILMCIGCQTSLLDYQMEDYKDHPCNRPCLEDNRTKLCKYKFVVENYYVLSKACHNCPFNQSDCLLPQCVPADGVRRGIKVVNRMMPGPSIQVCQFDRIEVTVVNGLDSAEGTSIHWHGILQKGTQHMDGVSLLTQCPITYHSYFTYSFYADDPGTHFWHGHSGSQRADGLYGSLIVRKQRSREPYSYTHDLPEHVIMLSDWMVEMATERVARYVHYDYNNDPELMLINGMGRHRGYTDNSSNTFFTPYATFTVKSGENYRFRLINAGLMNCALQLSIDNHQLRIIEADGSPVRELTTDSITSYSGESYDFLLDARTYAVRNYWIRVRGIGNCDIEKNTQVAILKYEGAPDVLPPEPTTWEDALRKGITFNQASFAASNTNYEVSDLVSAYPEDYTLTGRVDKQIYMAIDFTTTENPRSHNHLLYPYKQSKLKFFTPQINGITALLPPSPPLTQLKDLSEDIFCNAETVTKNCKIEWCSCVHLYKVALGDLVEVILVDEGRFSHAYHPMHLHGHKIRIVGMGKLNETTTLAKVKELDCQGQIIRNVVGAPSKDTVVIPDGGYTIFRFRADNPGFWFFHCHIEFHAEVGMGLVFQVGETSQLPQKPKNFPTCGNWEFTGYDNK